jgi:hypothetical protein
MDGRLNEEGGETHTTNIEKPYWEILFNEGKARIISFAITNRVTGTHNYLAYKL